MAGSSSPSTAQEERRLAGRYLLRRPVGRGGAGVVWEARDELLGRTVAIKECILPPTVDDADRDRLLARVMREARTAARLDHPALVTVFDVVQENDRPWIVMEYVDSRSLSQVVRQDGPMSPIRVVDIGLAVIDALEVAHSGGVLHRDVKPANVLLTESGGVVLTDFGIAASTGDPTLTTSGVLLGSPAYMPPERARGEAASPASDLWSLAATLYTCLEGIPPYSGDHPLAVLSAVAEGRRRPMQGDGDLERLIAEVLDSEPDDRPSAMQLRRRLERIRAELAAESSRAAPQPVQRQRNDDSGEWAAEHTARFEAQRPQRQRHLGGSWLGRRSRRSPADGTNDSGIDALFGGAAGAAAGQRAEPEPDQQVDGAAAPSPDFSADEAPPVAPTAPEAGPVESPEPVAPEAVAAEALAPQPEVAQPEAATEVSQPQVSTPEPAQPIAPTEPEPAASVDTDAAPEPQPIPETAAQTSAPTAAQTVAEPEDRSEPAPAPPALAAPAATEPEPRSHDAYASPGVPAPRPAANGTRRRRLPLVLGVVALLAVAAVALVLVLVNRDPSKPAAVPGVPNSSAGTSGGSTGGTSSGSGSTGTSNSSTAPSGGTASTPVGTGAAVPAGWQTYKDSRFGWSIGVPPGFVQTGDGTTNQTDFRDSATGTLLRVEIAPQAHASAIGDWRTYEPTFARQVSDYQRVRIAPVDGGDGSRAADWEFLFSGGSSRLHVLNRGVVDGHTAHALYWQTPDSNWQSSAQLRDTVFSTFQPPPQ